jgi:lysophospholipase L1-like esterase
MVTTNGTDAEYSEYFEPYTLYEINMEYVNAYTKEEIDSLKFGELFSQLELLEALNLYNKNTSTNGYIAANGSISESTTYCYSAKIPVEVGKTYTFWALNNGAVISANARFLCAYDEEENAITDAGSNSAVSNYTVPDGIATIVISFEQNRRNLFMVVDGTEQPSDLLPYREEHYIATAPFIYKAFGELSRGNEFIKLSVGSVSANQEKILATHIDNKKNCAYSFFGRFSSFSSVEIGHGKTETGACYMIINGTNVTTYSPSGSVYSQQAHGLTIRDFISVSIKVADTKTARATVNIITNGGNASLSNIIFFGCNGRIYFKCGQTTTGCNFTYNIMDLRKDVFVFGDSYTSLASDARWPEYAITNNDNNMLLSGFAGANSAEEYQSFENLIQMKKPKYLCWFLGMNDPDLSGSIDSSWVATVYQVLSACNANGITPILATIPNTPTQRNIEKNNWVKASGYRYVDFASAVGASEANSSWYTGMLSSDNVHPTAEGAKALWLQMRMDVPEIMQPTTT